VHHALTSPDDWTPGYMWIYLLLTYFSTIIYDMNKIFTIKYWYYYQLKNK